MRTAKIAVAANTNVQVAGESAGGVRTKGRSTNIKLCFVPTSTAGVVVIAETAAQLTAGEGFPIRTSDATTADVFQGSDEIELVSDDDLWVRATVAGALYALYV